jgi:hypothetical protein
MDPAYFDEVEKWYQAVGKQAAGFCHKEGGPIIGVQLDNEFGHVGGQGGDAYILKCKDLARKHGFDVPYYSVCGWGGAWVPRDEVLPVQSSYIDPFWGVAPLWRNNSERLPPPPELLFNDFGKMAASSQVGGDVAKTLPTQFQLRYDFNRYPLAMAELGCDMLPCYGRRPLLTVCDNVGNALCRLGEGANLIGYYMYHGGSQPRGESGFLVEKGATREDQFASVSYDFGVLSEFGKVKESFNPLKRLHYFINSFGEELNKMTPSFPIKMPKPDDPQQLRYMLRSDGKSGYLFFNNYQRYIRMTDQEKIQFSVSLTGSELVFPDSPIMIPSGTMGIFPVNKKIGDATLLYSTAQLLTDLSNDKEIRIVLFAIPGIRPEVAFQNIKKVIAGSSAISEKGNNIIIEPVVNKELVLEQNNGRILRLLVLDDYNSLNSWQLYIKGQKYLAFTEDEVFQDNLMLKIRSTKSGSKNLLVYPEGKFGGQAVMKSIPYEIAGMETENPDIQLIETFKLKEDKEWDLNKPSVWDIKPGSTDWEKLSDLILNISYTGDYAGLYLNGELVADNLWREPVWKIALKRWKKELIKPGALLQLKIDPWKNGNDVFVNIRPEINEKYTAKVLSVKAIPEQTVQVDLAGFLTK